MKNPTKQGVRRMLITTLGRIERGEEALRDLDMTAAQRAQCIAANAKERENLRKYNEIARQLVAAERS